MSVLIALTLVQAAASPTSTQATSPDDSKIVCRTVNETGSRLGGKRVCMTKFEWRRLHEQSQATAREYQNHQSKQPGND